MEISLEGPSMGSAGESILRAALLGQTRCLVRLDSAQGERMAGEFWVTRFEQIADAEALERLRVSLRSHGPVTVTAL